MDIADNSSNKTNAYGLTPLTTDYIQMYSNALMVLIGVPLNLVTSYNLVRQYQTSTSRIHLLYLNLNLSDLMVLFFYSLTKFFWLFTYKWLAGDAMCRIMKFLESFSFAFSSNVIVTIAIDRLYSLYKPISAESLGRVTKMLSSAWLLATLASIPQLFVWQIYVPRDYPTFTQCVTIWIAQEDEFNQTSSDGISWRLYGAYHLLIVFWIPLIILVVCYGFILKAVIAVARTAKKDAEFRRQSDPKINEREALYHSNGHERLRRAKVKAWKMTLILVTLYMACWFPYNTLSWWKIIDPDSYKNTENHFYFLHSLIVLNSVLNPLVYGRINSPCGLVVCPRGKEATKRRTTPQRKH